MAKTLTETDQALKVRQWIATGRARKLRHAAGLSMAAAGRDCEVEAASILRWERGDRAPRGRNVGAYFRLLTRLEQAIGHTIPDA